MVRIVECDLCHERHDDDTFKVGIIGEEFRFDGKMHICKKCDDKVKDFMLKHRAAYHKVLVSETIYFMKEMSG